jgi:hypothetical protein
VSQGRRALVPEPGLEQAMTSIRSVAVRRGALVAAALLVLGGCASMMQPSTPVTSLDQLAGKWQGLITFPGRFDQFMYLTIEPDGRLFATWGSIQAWGTATVEGGKARFQMSPPPFAGDLKLYGSGPQRALFMQELWGSFTANLNPQR